MRQILFFLVFVASGAFGQNINNLTDGRSGEVSFLSVTPKGDWELSQGTYDKTPVTVQAQLVLPPLASTLSKVPAVILQHGSSGVLPHYHTLWAARLREAGYATLIFDSFVSRGLKGTANNQGLLNPAADAADVISALRFLSTHPAIDKDRIAVVGFSRGGQTAMAVTHEKFRTAVLGDSDLRFALAVAHYPPCHYNYFESIASKTPIALFVGSDDDFVSPKSCEDYVNFMRTKGYEISYKVYQKNGHSYDADYEKVYQPRAEVYSGCEPYATNITEQTLSPLNIRTGARLASGLDSNAVIGKVYQWQKGCTSHGAYTGHNPSSDIRSQVVDDTIMILNNNLKK